jgi:hypothetical protein
MSTELTGFTHDLSKEYRKKAEETTSHIETVTQDASRKIQHIIDEFRSNTAEKARETISPS